MAQTHLYFFWKSFNSFLLSYVNRWDVVSIFNAFTMLSGTTVKNDR